MKKYGAVLLVLLLCGILVSAAAQAETTASESAARHYLEWLRHTAGEGMRFYLPGDEEKPLPPQGLEPMYRWMEMDGGADEAVLIAMPAGRVLAYAARSEIGTALRARELCDMWPRLAAALERGTLLLTGDADCASVIGLGDSEWMRVHTVLALDGESMLSLELEGYANCENGTMVEIWLTIPGRGTYRYDELASAELEADLEAARAWLNSISLPENAGSDAGAGEVGEAVDRTGAMSGNLEQEEKEAGVAGDPSVHEEKESGTADDPSAQEGMIGTAGDASSARAENGDEPAAEVPYIAPSETLVLYQDPEGQFSLSAPENMIVVEQSEVHAKMASVAHDVADPAKRPLFLHWLKDAEECEATLFIDPNYDFALGVMFYEIPWVYGLEDLEGMAPLLESVVSQDLTGSFTNSIPERTWLADVEYTFFIYEGDYQGRELSLLIMAAADGHAVRELNIWKAPSQSEDTVEDWADAMIQILESLRYGGDIE